ncbi:AMP-binding protein [Rhodococcus sp. NPDC019627]|uniref:AMP-binding protein n=1 Tax=unclassified Rhodococcus (in: high G+C Gram-positive bacteria) TaxID=192944 RepID=UPI003401DEF9
MSTTEIGRNLIHRINVGDSLTRAAWRRPEALALIDGDRRFTYREFNSWVNRVSHGLHRHGLRSGDALALASGNCAEFLVTYYACAKLGLVCVPINLGWGTSEISYVLDHSAATAVVVETEFLPRVQDALAVGVGVVDIFLIDGDGTTGDPTVTAFADLSNGSPDSEPEHGIADRAPLSYLYTSGTTSFPKGVVGNHAAIYLESMTMALEAQFREDDRFVAMMPMFHTAQLNTHCTAAIMVGATIFIERRFDAGRLLALIESERITQIFALPMMYSEMLEHADIGARDLSSLRRALYAMAPMPRHLIERCIEVFACDFYLLFGQTEMSPTTTLFRPEHQLTHTGAVGTPVIGVQAAIMGQDGGLLPAGGEGEIVYRSPHTMTEYLDNPEATAEAFTHGWFHSGDIGRFDDDGILWFTDRFKDVIKTGGENVSSLEVERAIYQADPLIAEATVVGLPHHRWSEAITAVVVPASGATVDPATLISKIKQLIDPYKIPKSIIVVDALPRTSTGKIQKNVVRDTFAEHYERR